MLPNLLKGFGWNPGNKLLKWFGKLLKYRAGEADITFRQVSTSVRSHDNTQTKLSYVFQIEETNSLRKNDSNKWIRSFFDVIFSE